MVNRILKDKIYIGIIENKITNSIYKGQHESIISKDIFEAVQLKLKENNNRKDAKYTVSNNLFINKIYDNNGVKFANKTTVKSKTNKIRYYVIKGLHIRAEHLESIIIDCVKNVITTKIDSIDTNNLRVLDRINYNSLSDEDKIKLTQKIVDKIIYEENKIKIICKLDQDNISEYISPNYINTNKDNNYDKNISYIYDNESKEIIIETDNLKERMRQKFNKLKIVDNMDILIKGLVLAFKYRDMYDNGIEISKIGKGNIRNIYRYITLSYLSPNIINNIFEGNINITLKELFKISEKYKDFSTQETAIGRYMIN